MKTIKLALATLLVSNVSFATLMDPSFTEGSQFGRELSVRAKHAKELMGGRYRKSIVKVTEKVGEMDDMVFDLVEKRLPEKYKSQSEAVAQTIIEQAQKYSFDPVFLMAVIANESSFNPEVVGTSGEIGLMQILPKTAKWFAKKADLGMGRITDKTLRNPVKNIQIGAAYMAYLRGEFDAHGQLYLAAYNMGKVNVKRALARSIMPKDYAGHVMNRYINFYTEIRTLHNDQMLAAAERMISSKSSEAVVE
ncbi:MAG: lytic transglycosylase domain-containing protein [Xanthomonadaceae bacterium]|nr:lytic transglycosylase domain-containing protein [Xanthomonadaceae bacterium]